jgi:hypothetical protein
MNNFDLKKYLENNRLMREDEFDSEEFEKEPTKGAVKGSEKVFRGLDKKKKELKTLRDQVRAIQKQFGVVDGKLPVTGVRTKDDQVKKNYIKMIGNLPQKIKTLKAQIDKMENPHLDLDQD